MFCKECGQNLEGASGGFCSKCGTKIEGLPELEVPEIVSGDKAEPAVMYCTECGRPGTADGVCEKCAAKKKSVKPQRDVMQAVLTFVKKKPVAVIAGAVVFVAVFVTIIVASAGRAYNPPYEVISFGRYDEIVYIGYGQFLVAREDWERTGVRDVYGNEIIEFGRFEYLFDEIDVHFRAFRDGNFFITDARTFYLFNRAGNEIVSFDRFDWVDYVTENSFIVYTGTGQNARVGVIDARGMEIIPIGRFDRITASNNGRWFRVQDGNRIGVLNASGTEIISMGRFDSILFAAGNRFIVSTGQSQNRRVAALDSRGQEIIALGRFDQIQAAGDSFFTVRDGNDWGVLNVRGDEVIPFRYSRIQMVGNNNFIVLDGDRTGVLDTRGNEIITIGRYDEISYAGNERFLVRSGGERTWGSVWEGARWGILDTRGNEVISFGRYDEIIPAPGDRFVVRSGGTFNEDTRVLENARWGVLDTRGTEIISSGRYDSIYWLRDSWLGREVEFISSDYGFIVQSGDRVGFRCVDGREIIPMGRYDEVQSMYNGLAIVARGGRVGVINTRRINEQ